MSWLLQPCYFGTGKVDSFLDHVITANLYKDLVKMPEWGRRIRVIFDGIHRGYVNIYSGVLFDNLRYYKLWKLFLKKDLRCLLIVFMLVKTQTSKITGYMMFQSQINANIPPRWVIFASIRSRLFAWALQWGFKDIPK